MAVPALRTVVESGLALVGWWDRSLPASYAVGAEVPREVPIPEIPRPAARGALSPEALDEAARDALAQLPTPPGHEPGLLEDVVERTLTMEAVEEVLDEMIRPALNADGGDITLVKIVDGDVYVKLVGACNTCPSAVMTMRMGVERLLQEEFPEMGELIQVEDGY